MRSYLHWRAVCKAMHQGGASQLAIRCMQNELERLSPRLQRNKKNELPTITAVSPGRSLDRRSAQLR